MVKNNPPMGWNTWNTFGKDVCEKVLLENVDEFVKKGFRDYGYEYIVIDDCWSLRERDKDGKLQADPKKFPHGIKYVSDYIHSKGLKFGMYSCSGFLTCEAYPGSYEHEYVDAKTFAEWGVDFLKYDYCYHTKLVNARHLYRRMGLALATCGREILFSACSWGVDNTPEWIRTCGATMWRSTMDVHDNWKTMLAAIKQQSTMLPYGGKNCFNDMDMLVVGMHGVGFVGFGGCTDTEYKTQFTTWCFFGSPLMMGCNISTLDEVNEKLLKNKELIAIDQDPLCAQAFRLTEESDEDNLMFARQLSTGELAILSINILEQEEHPFSKWISLESLGIPASSGKTLELRDVFTGEKTVVKNGLFTFFPEPHGCKLWIGKVIDNENGR